MDNVKKMDIKEFREMGLLAEVNRTFFHPAYYTLKQLSPPTRLKPPKNL